MGRRRSKLAARFRKAVERNDEARQRTEDAGRRAREAATRARDELLVDLQAIAEDIGVIDVKLARDGLTLRFRERYVHLSPRGDAEVDIEFEGKGDEVHRLYREAELDHRWVHLRKRRFREDRTLFFDQGLETLLVEGLGLPAPSDEDDSDPSGASGRSL